MVWRADLSRRLRELLEFMEIPDSGAERSDLGLRSADASVWRRPGASWWSLPRSPSSHMKQGSCISTGQVRATADETASILLHVLTSLGGCACNHVDWRIQCWAAVHQVDAVHPSHCMLRVHTALAGRRLQTRAHQGSALTWPLLLKPRPEAAGDTASV